MSAAVNKVILVGNVGADAELRTTPSGKRVATFSLATSKQWTDAKGDKQEKTQWHKCVVWNRGEKSGLADIADRFVTKGVKLYVEGEIEYRSYEDKDGQTRYVTEIVVQQLVLCGGGTGKQQGSTEAKSAKSSLPSAAEDFEDDDSELPF